jgi:methionine-rich copper-binding protein CopC
MDLVSPRRLPLLAGLGLLIVAMMWASPLAAHSELRERAPAADSTVGGEVTHVDLLFWTPIDGAEIQLFGPNQDVIEVSETSVSDSRIISSVEFPALTVAGRYAVTHTETSTDGDIQTAAFAFTFDPDSEVLVPSLLERSSGPNWVILAAIAGVVLVAAGLLAPRRSASTT